MHPCHRPRIQIRSVTAFLLLLVPFVFVACGDDSSTPTEVPDPPTGFEAPTSAQLRLDLPPSLATAPTSGKQPNCDQLEWPGEGFVCITRYLVGSIAMSAAGAVEMMLEEVMADLGQAEIPSGVPIDATQEGVRFLAQWDQTPDGRTYHLEFHHAATGIQMGEWDWQIANDGSASGTLDILGMMMDDPMGPDGIHFEFASNADGSDKSITMDIDMGDEPPIEDLGAPTAVRLVADKSGGRWVVQYGMFHPQFMGDSDPEAGIPVYVLVSAVGGVDVQSPGVMKVIALHGDATSIPADPDEQHSICDFMMSIWTPGSGFPQLTCNDNNPYYIDATGAVVEGGAPPTGFETLATELALLPFVVSDATDIRDLEIGF